MIQSLIVTVCLACGPALAPDVGREIALGRLRSALHEVIERQSQFRQAIEDLQRNGFG